MRNPFDISLLIIRVAFSFVMLAHGVQKLFGWFGGYGYTDTMKYFTDYHHMPFVLALSVILLESLGMVALMSGLFTRFLSFGIISIMLGAIFLEHQQIGFYMNWDGALQGEGFEFHLLVIAMAVIPALYGGGKYSLDNYLTTQFGERQPSNKWVSETK